MASSVIGSLRVNLGLDSAQFSKGAKTANATLKNMQRQFVAVAGVAAAVGGALTTLTIATSKTAVSIKNLSQVSSALPGEFQKWAVAAKTVGIEQEKLGDILKDVNDRVGDFLTTGGGPMADFFENIAPKIGITADAFRDLSGPQALQLYVDSLQKAGLSQQEMTFYLEAMASDTTALIPLLRDGGAEMKRLGDNAASLGGIMKDSTVASLSGLRAALDDAGTAVRGIGFRISGELAPALTTLVTSFNDSMREGGLLRGVIDGMIGTISTLGEIASTVAQSFDILAISIGTLAAMRIPALLAGINSVSVALVASQAVIYATAAASAALSLAMNAIPFVAIVTGITAIVRLGGAIMDSRASAVALSASMGDMIGSLARLDAASNAYYSNVTRGNYMAAKAAADFTKAQAEEALQAARNHLAAQERISNMLYLGLAESEGVRNARAAVLDMGNALLEADARASAFAYSAEKMNILFGDVIPIVGGTTTAIEGYTAATFAAIPAADELNTRYGAMAETMRGVLEAQNSLAAADASAGIAKLLTDISGVSEKLGLGVDQAGDFQQALANIGSMNTFQEQAQAMAGLASHLLDANGDLSSMNAETRQVYQSLLDAADGAAVMGQQVAIAEANTTALGAAIANIAPQFAPAIAAANTLATAVGNVLAKLGGVASGLLNLSRTASAVADATGGAVGFFKDLGGTAVGAASAALASVAGNLKSVWSESTKSGASVASLTKHLKDLVSPSSGGGGGGGSAAKKLSEDAKDAAEQLRLAERAAEQLKNALDRPMLTVIDGMANAFGDLVASGMRDFKEFGKAILSSITSAISQAVSFAIANPIKVALGLSGGIAGGGALTGGTEGGGGILGSLASNGGIFGKIAEQGIFGASGIFGSIGSSIGTSIGGILGGANSAIATSLGSLGATLGSIVPIIGIAAAAFSFFKKKTEVLAAGIRVTITDLDAVIQSFETVKTTRFWGLSKKVRTSLTDMEERAAEPFIAAIDSVVAGIEGATANLGLSSEKLANFDYTFDVDTRGKSQEEVQKLLEQEMTGFADAAANALVGTFTEVIYDQDLINKLQQEVQQQSDRTPYGGGASGIALAEARAGTVVEHFSEVGELFEELRKVGEGTSDTLQRLSNSLTASNAAFDTLGHALFDNSVQGAGYAASLLDLFGGMEAFATATTSYYNTFYSEAERMAVLTRRVTDEFSSLNLTMPDTRAAFRALVEAQDLTTEAGREAYASLISMSGSIAELIPEITEVTDATGNLVEVVEALTEAERQRETLLREFYTLTGDTNALRAMELAALDESNHALQRRIWKIEDEAAALAKLESAVSAAMRGVSDSIANEIANINSKTDARLALLGANLDRKRANQDRARNYIQDYIDQITTDTVDRFRAMRDAVRSALESRGPVSVDAQRQSYFSASANLQSFAQSGNYSQDQLSGALSGIDVDSAQFFGKQADYAFEYAKTNGALRTIDGQTTRELTDAEKTVEALEKLLEIEEEGFDTLDQAIKTLERATAKEESILKQMEALEFWRESQILNLEAQLTQAQMQTNAILMVDASVKGVGAAITGLGAAIGNLATAQRAAAEAQARIPQAPAANTARAPSSMSESAPMVDELRAMRAELSQIKELNRSTAISAAKSEKLQKKWDIDGNPETRTA